MFKALTSLIPERYSYAADAGYRPLVLTGPVAIPCQAADCTEAPTTILPYRLSVIRTRRL